MYADLTAVTHLDLAITSVCNAHCVDCARWWVDDQFNLYHNPRDTHSNHHWPIDQLTQHLSGLSNIHTVIICGNAGDPFTHPGLADVCEFMVSQWPQVQIEIDTNGSLGSELTWQRLAHTQCVTVRFAVDGLEHTNHIYRRGVKWSRVVNNIKQWHRLDQTATIKTIDFPWNQPDRNTIREWSQQLGWPWQLDARWHPEWDAHILAHSQSAVKVSTWPHSQTDDHDHTQHTQRVIRDWIEQGRPMVPECKTGGEWLYINHDHRVWPCCYWANVAYVQADQSQWHQQQLLAQTDPTWNSLDHHPLCDIIADPVFRNLEHLWSGSDIANTCSVCIHQCGRSNS